MFTKYISVLIVACTLLAVSVQAQTNKEKPVTNNQAPTLTTIKYKVSGITCANDCKDIQKTVSKLTGVTNCKQVGKASATTVFEITFDTAIITEKEIRAKVEDVPGCDDPTEKPYKVKLG